MGQQQGEPGGAVPTGDAGALAAFGSDGRLGTADMDFFVASLDSDQGAAVDDYVDWVGTTRKSSGITHSVSSDPDRVTTESGGDYLVIYTWYCDRVTSKDQLLLVEVWNAADTGSAIYSQVVRDRGDAANATQPRLSLATRVTTEDGQHIRCRWFSSSGAVGAQGGTGADVRTAVTIVRLPLFGGAVS